MVYFLCLVLLFVRSVRSQLMMSTFTLTPLGTAFQPPNPVELLVHFSPPKRLSCSMACFEHSDCRVFDYDSASKRCRLFESMPSTGTVTGSSSSCSVVGEIRLSPENYLFYNQSGDRCQGSRYLMVNSSSNLCTCPRRTFWNGSMCLNQVYEGSACQADDWCRADFDLICQPMQWICTPRTLTITMDPISMHSTSTIGTSSMHLTTVIDATPMYSTTTIGTASIHSTAATSSSMPVIINFNRTYPAPVNSSNAAAGLYGVNLLANGDGETGPCAMNLSALSPTLWSSVGSITQIAYNNPAFVDMTPTSPGPSDRGLCYFVGMFNVSTTMSQSINLTVYASAIDSGNVSLNLSAWLGGYASQDDSAQVSIDFFNRFFQRMGNQSIIGPVLAADRNSITSMIFRQRAMLVPLSTRYLTVIVTALLVQGDNDGLADNIAVVLNRS